MLLIILKKVSREELELLDADEIDNYYNIVNDIEIILSKYSYYICKQVKDNIKDIVNKRNERCNKSSYKPTKEDLSKLRKEDLINMIINEEEPKKTKIEIIAIIQLLYIIVCLFIVSIYFYYRYS